MGDLGGKGEDDEEPSVEQADICSADPPKHQLPALPSGYTRPPNVESDLWDWYSLDEMAQQARLNEVAAGKRRMHPGALVHLCARTSERNDQRLLDLAFNALSRTSVKLILACSKGVRDADREDHVQEVLLHVFRLVLEGKAHFAEASFEGVCRRYAIDLFRKRKSKIEGKLKQASPSTGAEGDEPEDPLDGISSNEVSVEDRALANIALDSLPNDPPESLRSLFIQHHQFNLTQEELAKKYGVADKTIRNRLNKAAKLLDRAGERK